MRPRVEATLHNARVMLLTFDPQAELFGMPLWKHAYHMLHSCDRWFINPACYEEPPFHTPGLGSLDDPVFEPQLTREDLLAYLETIRAKVLAYMDATADGQWAQPPKDTLLRASSSCWGSSSIFAATWATSTRSPCSAPASGPAWWAWSGRFPTSYGSKTLKNLRDYPRIAVIGCPGSGKSTLARQLAEKIGHPLIHLDYHHWQPGWVPTPKDEWRAMQKQWVKGERWIIEGNYHGTMEIRFAAADLVVCLDLSRWLCLWRVLKRRGTPRPDMRPGVEETGSLFTNDSLQFLWFIVGQYHKKNRPTIKRLREKYPDVAFIRLRTRRAVRAFLEGCL